MPTYAKIQHNHLRSEDTKHAILKSAEKLFSANGFNKTTVREIAGDSGVNVAMIYYYFQTKDGLHQEILENACIALSESLTECINPQKGPEENLRCIITTYINFLQQHKTLHRIVLRAMVSQSKQLGRMVKKYGANIFGMIHSQIEEGVTKGIFRKQDTTLSTINLFSMIRHYFTDEPFITMLFPQKKGKLQKNLSDHIYNLFMNGINKEA
jgi:AcrR family transcriptional regulator